MEKRTLFALERQPTVAKPRLLYLSVRFDWLSLSGAPNTWVAGSSPPLYACACVFSTFLFYPTLN